MNEDQWEWVYWGAAQKIHGRLKGEAITGGRCELSIPGLHFTLKKHDPSTPTTCKKCLTAYNTITGNNIKLKRTDTDPAPLNPTATH